MWIIVCIPNLFPASFLHTRRNAQVLNHSTGLQGKTKITQKVFRQAMIHFHTCKNACSTDKGKPWFRARSEFIYYGTSHQRHDKKGQILTVDRETRTLRNLEEVSETMSFSRVVPYSAKRPRDIPQKKHHSPIGRTGRAEENFTTMMTSWKTTTNSEDGVCRACPK